LSYAMAVGMVVYLLQRDTERARELAQENLKLTGEYGFIYFYTHSMMILAILADADHIEEGIQQVSGAMAGLGAAGAELLLPMYQSWLAEIYAGLGKIEEGLASVAAGLSLVERGEEYIWEADLHRVKGDLLLLKSADESEVESCFQKAISIAKEQGTKLYELRAVMGLSRLWQKQGKTKEACALLSEVYNWFSEGFDTVDLREAKALLESLS
jgi:predicted ATPase